MIFPSGLKKTLNNLCLMAHVALMARARCPREGQRETHHCEMLVWDHQSVLKTPLRCCPASPLSPMSPPTVMDALPPAIV